MKLMAVNTVEEASRTLITLRFDSAPEGAESFVLDWIEEVDKEKVSHSSTVTATVDGNNLIIRKKFPAQEFTLTHTVTGAKIPFNLDSKVWAKEITFFNESDKAAFYLPTEQANRINQIEVRKLNGDVWTTYYHGTWTEAPIFFPGPVGSVGMYVPEKRFDDEGVEELKSLRKATVEIQLDSDDSIRTYKDLLPTGRNPERITSYEGLLDFDELGIF